MSQGEGARAPLRTVRWRGSLLVNMEQIPECIILIQRYKGRIPHIPALKPPVKTPPEGEVVNEGWAKCALSQVYEAAKV